MSLTKRIPEVLGLVAALVLAGGCETLNVKNPNAPDSARLLTDPATVQSIAIGAMRTWFSTTQGPTDGADPYPGPTLTVMARSHVAAWNNYNIRFYTGCTDGSQPGAPLPWTGGGAASLTYTAATLGTCGGTSYGAPYPRIEWQNDPASAQRTQVEFLWYGYYSALSAANDVVTAIRKKGLVITDATTTKMVETMGVLVQGLCLSQISLMYDKGFIVDENSDLTSLTFSTRAQMRDAAVAKFDDVINNLTTTTFTVPGDFFGKPGQSYTNVKIKQIASTMAARALAYFPRTAAENADISAAGGQVDWARVVSYAENGISSGAPFDWLFHQDGCINWCDFLKVWTNDLTTMRVHTRVAHQMDPATQPDPWNLAANSQPSSPDARLGDGTMRADRAGPAYADAMEVDPDLTGNGGYDYVWVAQHQENQNKSRGLWHQSAIGQVRYDSLTACGDNPQGQDVGIGDTPVILAAESDLIWAEGLLRSPAPPPSAYTAADLINFTHVGPDRLGRPRGVGLTPSTGTLADLQYEQDVELMGSNAFAPFINQRRIDNLEPFTPHEMPVPAKELGVLQQPLYTWGGQTHPASSSPTAPAPGVAAALVLNAQQRWAELEHQMLTAARSGRGFRK